MITELVIIGVLLLFGIPTVLVYFLQHKIIFTPYYHKRRGLFKAYPERYIPLELQVQKGLYLEGVVYEPEAGATETLLFFGGREQDSVTLVAKLSLHFPEVRLVAFNYRAYGKSDGVPSEYAYHGDALKVYDLVKKRYGVPYILGYSLGSNIALHTAVRREAKALVMVAPFSSVVALSHARKILVPRFFIKHRFESIKEIVDLEVPLYIYATRDDGFVPISQPRELKEQVKKGVLMDYKEYDGYNHAQLLFSDEVIEEIRQIITK